MDYIEAGKLLARAGAYPVIDQHGKPRPQPLPGHTLAPEAHALCALLQGPLRAAAAAAKEELGRDAREERAAIMIHDGLVPAAQAEAEAAVAAAVEALPAAQRDAGAKAHRLVREHFPDAIPRIKERTP